VTKACRKGFDSLVMLTVWKLWLQRNRGVFNGKAEPATSVIKNVIAEARCWISADIFISPHG
jgi:hypothetical protein